MASSRLFLLTSLAMLFFAGNSVLCRLAFWHDSIDAASFTAIRLLSGALTLVLLNYLRQPAAANVPGKLNAHHGMGGNWRSAIALFVYVASFSFAYVSLPTGTGALLLFGAVQATMILAGLWSGEKLSALQASGLLIAMAGLLMIMLPGLSAPSTVGALLMLTAGIAWGIYSLLGRQLTDPTSETAGNFFRAAKLSVLLLLVRWAHIHLDGWGVGIAVLSGAIASGIGYAIWYAVLPGLTAIRAASVQLSVPVIAALGGMLFLHETITLRLLMASVVILGGIVLVMLNKRSTNVRSGEE
jgi:drug/metabolite transporter (DMT)-like permease